MGKIYDNWERLVEAVLLKEELRRLALCHSREPSSGSSGSSRFSFSDDQELIVYDELSLQFPAAKPDVMNDNNWETIKLLKESLSNLGLQRLSIDEVHRMEWTLLQDEIDKWVEAANVTIQILFPSERRLCDFSDLSFMEVCRGSTIQLLNFAYTVAIGSRAPERLFSVLDLYKTLRDLMPKFELIFSDQYGVSLRIEPITIWKRLGEGIRGIFMEVEHLIRMDPAKAAPVPDGGLHPMTRYVMNYLRAACRSRLTLEEAFEEDSVVSSDGNLDDRKEEDRSLSSLAVQMAWILELLESNLEAKSKIYEYPDLCCVFMMNNERYIVEKVKNHELGTLLGNDWVREHEAKVWEYHLKYHWSLWSKALGVLNVDDFRSMSHKEASKSLKEKLSHFNSYFEEICETQTSWVIFDEQLAEELRISVSGILSPAYRNFIGRMRLYANVDRYMIKYSVEDVEARVSELFQGGPKTTKFDAANNSSWERMKFLKESLSRLGLQRLSIDEVQRMEWTLLEDEIDKWVKAAKVTIQTLFPSEWRLCDYSDLSFMEVCRGSIIQLLNFADAVAIGSRAPERLFKLMDIYETLRDLMPELELILSDQYSVSLTICKRLGEAIRGMFMEVENLIRRDSSKALVPGGGLHPITRYVISYLRAACWSRLTLEQVFEDSVALPGGTLDYRKGEDRSLSPLNVQMAWIIELLESNLEAKSKIYKDPALCSVFMMNNGRYIVEKVKDNELGTLLGDDWIRKHAAKVRQYHVNYQRSSWSKVLGVLKVDSFSSMSPNQASKSLKEKLSLFNSYFEEICKIVLVCCMIVASARFVFSVYCGI